ncbi:MAG: hypothetical protein NTY82_01845 [Actinobacteria bacterium]|nr:hypothetical protein [Actinomycetota bacterium]
MIEIKNRIGDEKGSKNSFKPDIIAVHDFEILVIEIKPKYSSSDQEKLLSFLVDPDRISAFWHEVELRRLVNDRGTQLQESNHSFIIHGALAYRGLPAQPCPLWQFVQDDSGEFRRFSPCPASLE